MKVFGLLINGVIQQDIFTGLRTLCKHYGISYSSASKADSPWRSNGRVYSVVSLHVNKIKGRAKNFKATKKRPHSEEYEAF